MNTTLRQQIAVITGAAQGIGRACAQTLADAGAAVALLDIDSETLAETAANIRQENRSVLELVCDCTDATAVNTAFQQIENELGPVDILVNNIGQSARAAASEFWLSDEKTWRFVLDVSLLSTMRWSRLVVPSMRQRRTGRIINISSDTALVGDTGLVDYASAKMGVIGFTRALARELAPFQVTVNSVCPGAIHTRAHDTLPAQTLDRIRASVPLGFVGEPEDVAQTVAFLASPGGRYITGQSILIDGGRWMV